MIDSIIFVGFLIVNIMFGLMSSRGIKSLKEFAVGDKSFSTATISATLIATYLSGSGFFIELSRTYDYGLYFIWSLVAGITFLFLSTAFIFGPRMREFLGKVSIADALGTMFGKRVRIITAVAGFLGASAITAMQLKVAGTLFEYGLGFPLTTGIIILGLIIASYSSLGGIKSVTFTDVIQFFTFGTIIPTLGYFIISSMNNYQEVINIIQYNELYNVREVFDFTRPKSLKYLSIFFVLAIPSFSAVYFQRISMAKDIAQVKHSHIIACCICVSVVLITCFISLLVLSQNPNLKGTEVLQYILSHYSQSGLRGLTLVGIMAMVMSTADSYINSTSVLFVHDFCKPLKLINFITDELLAIRIVSFLLGCGGIVMALHGSSLFQLFIMANTFFMPIVTPVFMMAIFGFRPHKNCVLIAMLGGFSGTFIWEFIVKYPSIDSLLPGMLLNFICLISSHYILKLPGGWINTKPEKDLGQISQKRKFKLNEVFNKISNFKPYEFFGENNLSNQKNYLTLGAICIISGMVNIFTLSQEVHIAYKPFVTFIHVSVLYIGTLFLAYPLWERLITNKIAISIFWNLSIFYVLVCVGFFLALISDFAHLQLMSFILYAIILTLIVKWRVALFMLITGVLITTCGFQLFFHNDIALGFTEGRIQATYILLFLGSVFLIFLRPKETYVELVEGQRDFVNNMLSFKNKELEQSESLKSRFINNVVHEYNTPMTGVVSMSQILSECHDKLTDEQKKIAANNIYESAKRIDFFEQNIQTLHKLAAPNYQLNKIEFSFSDLLIERIAICQKLLCTNSNRKFESVIEHDIIIYADKYYITQVLDNLIFNAITYCINGEITINLKIFEQGIKFSISDNGIGIPDTELDEIFEEFVVSSRTETPAGGRGIGLTVCKRVVEAHGGKIYAQNKPNTIFQFVIPQ